MHPSIFTDPFKAASPLVSHLHLCVWHLLESSDDHGHLSLPISQHRTQELSQVAFPCHTQVTPKMTAPKMTAKVLGHEFYS